MSALTSPRIISHTIRIRIVAMCLKLPYLTESQAVTSQDKHLSRLQRSRRDYNIILLSIHISKRQEVPELGNTSRSKKPRQGGCIWLLKSFYLHTNGLE